MALNALRRPVNKRLTVTSNKKGQYSDNSDNFVSNQPFPSNYMHKSKGYL